MGKKGNETKALILEKSCELFAIKGYKDVTMKDICEAAGLSRGGLYRHYDSTCAIFTDILTDLQKKQNDSFTEKIKQGFPAIQILDEELAKMEKEMQDAESDIAIAMYEFCVVHKEEIGNNILKIQYENGEKTWSRLIQYGIETGEFDEVDVRAVIAIISFAYEGVRMCSEVMKIDEVMANRVTSQIRRMLVK